MRRIGKYIVAAAFGLLAASAFAGGMEWQAARSTLPGPAEQASSIKPVDALPPALFPVSTSAELPPAPLPLPIPVTRTPAATLGQPIPAAVLGAPMPASAMPVIAPVVRPEPLPLLPVSFTSSADQFPRRMPDGPMLAPEPSGTASPDKAPDKTPVDKAPDKTPATIKKPEPVSIIPNVETLSPSIPVEMGIVPSTDCGAGGCGTCVDGCTTCCGGCGGCGGCCAWDCVDYGPHCLYVQAEYLLWFTRRANTPPLVTTSNSDDLGVIGKPSTAVLFGGLIDNDPRSGGRITAGCWLDNDQCWGVEGSFFFLPTAAAHFSAQSDANGNPVIMRPFVLTGAQDPTTGNLLPDQEFAEQVAVPGEFAGKVSATLTSQLWGAEANLRANLLKCCCYRVDLLGGFRFINLDERLSINEDFNSLVGDLSDPVGSRFVMSDMFRTSNQFYGGQIGAGASCTGAGGCWMAQARLPLVPRINSSKSAGPSRTSLRLRPAP